MKATQGWTVIGKLLSEEETDSSALMVNAMYVQGASETEFWDLDAISTNEPVSYKSRKEMELAALSHFQQTVKVADDSRYEGKV